MIKFLMIMIMIMVGCTAQVQPAVPSSSKVVVEVNIPKPENPSVGAVVGDGVEKGVGVASKWVWNWSKWAWEVVNNEEYQKRVREGVVYTYDWVRGLVVKVGKSISE